jgi:phosphoesterase RecJ-like protein
MRDARAARELLAEAKHIAVVAHERPDGDAIGSLLALGQSLKLKGKQVALVISDGVPRRFQFLPGAEEVVAELPEAEALVVSVDVADSGRLALSSSLGRKPDINFDHHPTNTQFAKLNLVDESAASTTQVIYDLAERLDLPLNSEIATNLLVGLLTDTIGFRTQSVNPKVLRMAADLLEMGAPLADLYQRAIISRKYEAIRYWGNSLSALNKENGLIWASLSLEDRHAADYSGSDDADLTDLLTTVDDMQIVVVLVELSRINVKVSWRAAPGFDVAALAEQFGGGGHVAASGATLEGTLPEVESRVIAATRKLLSPKVEQH